jgi:serine phosphatase RsbU (regulator of sigma subunit)
METLRKILLVEDSDDDAELLRVALRHTPFCVERAERMSAALERLAHAQFDIVLLDLSLPDSRGFETFTTLHAHAPHVAIIVFTGLDDEELGLRAVQSGAQDYLVKGDAGTALLVRAIRYAFERKRAEELTTRIADELRVRNAEMQEDLNLAREVQEAFLPQQYPSMPRSAQDAGSLRFSHRYAPAGIVGGDFFDVACLTDEKAAVFICDVMGHGVRAALVTALLRALVGEAAAAAARPGEMLARLNHGLRAIFRQTESPMFVSAFYGVVDSVSGEVIYANAGHPSPVLVRGGGRLVMPLQPTLDTRGPVLGLLDAPGYPTCHATLQRGDRLVLFTDGIYEVDGPEGECYGQERLHAAAGAGAGLQTDAFLDRLWKEVREFSGTGSFSDDACVLAMDFFPDEQASDRVLPDEREGKGLDVQNPPGQLERSALSRIR